MKNIISILLVLFCSASMLSQRLVEKQEAVSKDETIYLNLKFANDIKVEQWDKDQVAIEVSVSIDDGEGNSYYDLKTKRTSGELKVYSDFGDYFKMKQEKRNRNNHYYNHSSTEIDYVVKIPRNASLRVKSISGSLMANTFDGTLRTDLISGDITLKKYNGDLRLKTVSGDVDVTMNKAKIDVRTVTGTIYSDLDIDQNGRKSSGSNTIRGVINNGDELIVMETVSGNIYMRKG